MSVLAKGKLRSHLSVYESLTSCRVLLSSAVPQKKKKKKRLQSRLSVASPRREEV